MDKDLIVAFINSGSEVLFELLNEKPKTEKVEVIEKTNQSQGVAIIIGITGSLNGRIIVDLSPSTAHKISEVILQETLNEDDIRLIESAVGELGNMVAGRAVSFLSEMGHSLKITPPTIFKGEEIKVIDKNPKKIIAPLNTKVGQIILNLSVDAS